MAVEKNNVVVVEYEFGVPAPKVFEALKAGRLLFNCGFWPSGSTFDFRVGGKYTLDAGHHGNMHGEFTNIKENKLIAFTWIFDEDAPPTQVTIELTPKGDRCLAVLRHEGFVDKEIAEAHNGGWTKGLGGMSDELSKFRVYFDREFPMSTEMLYQACSGSQFLSFMGATGANAKIDFSAGGRFHSDLEKSPFEGRFLEIEKNKKIVFSWETSPCGLEKKPTKVTMEFGPWGDDGKNSFMELTHEGLTSAESAKTYHTGWSEVLEKIYKKGSR